MIGSRSNQPGREGQLVKYSVLLAFLAAVAAPVAAHAETVTYTYDAKGRVVGVSRSGGPLNGTSTTYTYDKADNRTNVTVANSPLGNGNGQGSGATASTTTYIVVPLNGFTLIPITQ